MQVVKLDWVVVARRMQHHAVRCRTCLFVADIGVAHETSMVIDGSPLVGAVPNQFAAGFAAPLALGGFAAGAIIGSTIGHGGYYGPPKASHP
jgi:hypothetical protein